MPSLKLLIIEDDPGRIAIFQSWRPENVHLVVASSAGRAMGILQRDRGRVYAGILLDHDLQDQAVTQADRFLSGSDLVRVIVQNVSKQVPVLVHSMNISRAPVMVEQLESAGFWVTRIPMSVLTRAQFLEWLTEVTELWEEEIE